MGDELEGGVFEVAGGLAGFGLGMLLGGEVALALVLEVAFVVEDA